MSKQYVKKIVNRQKIHKINFFKKFVQENSSKNSSKKIHLKKFVKKFIKNSAKLIVKKFVKKISASSKTCHQRKPRQTKCLFFNCQSPNGFFDLTVNFIIKIFHTYSGPYRPLVCIAKFNYILFTGIRKLLWPNWIT